jgi:chemotaxis protein MotB
MKTVVVAGLGAALLLSTVGCGVSQDLYNAKVNALQKCQADLAKKDEAFASLDAEYKGLKGRLAGVEGEKGALSSKLSASQKELEDLRRARAAAEARAATFRNLVAKLKSMLASGKIQVSIRNGKLVVKLSDKILFDPGKTALKKEGQDALRQVANALKEINDRDFQIAGHTDNVPIKNPKFPSNWELSTARAVNVVKFLQNEGMNPNKIHAAGYSEFDPVAQNDSPTNKSLNRRIEIVLMPNLSELPQIGAIEGVN